MARLANLAHLASNLQSSLGRRRCSRASYQMRQLRDGLLNVEGSAAFSAKGVGGPVLDKAAEIAAHNLTRFHAH
jgi:hypothetical protein